jgi:SIR2-like protein
VLRSASEMTIKRVFFLGAGASRAVGLPVTSELICGLAWAIMQQPRVLAGLKAYLSDMFMISADHLSAAASYWDVRMRGKRGRLPGRLPDLVEILTSLDVLVAEGTAIGFAGARRSLTLDVRMLESIREQCAQALSESLEHFDSALRRGRRLGAAIDDFARSLVEHETIVTTNWDILIDRARDKAFGTLDGEYGTRATLVLPGRARGVGQRPGALLKLHGSLNWLYCPRCSVLWINPRWVISSLQYYKEARKNDAACDCGFPLSNLIITPSFIKAYRNLHFGNIWSAAHAALAAADEWVFVGYSLPHDDLHIRTMLLRARRMREETKARGPALRVVMVGLQTDAATKDRYRTLFKKVEFHDAGFEEYITTRTALARSRRTW